jgi:hypothetical protein
LRSKRSDKKCFSEVILRGKFGDTLEHREEGFDVNFKTIDKSIAIPRETSELLQDEFIKEHSCSSLLPISKSSLCDGIQELIILENMSNVSLNTLTLSDDEETRIECKSELESESSKWSLSKSEGYHSDHSSSALLTNENSVKNGTKKMRYQYEELKNPLKEYPSVNKRLNQYEIKRSETIDCGITNLTTNKIKVCVNDNKFHKIRSKFDSNQINVNTTTSQYDFPLEKAFGTRFLSEAGSFFNDNVRNLVLKFESSKKNK